jgi:hypothetical protein
MATRSQSSGYIQWSSSDSKLVTTGTTESSDDYTWDSNMIGTEITIKGVSAGSAADDILDIYYSRKKNLEYDDQAHYVCSVDCSSGSGIKTMNFNSAFPADTGRFSVSCAGTNNITVSIFATQDKLSF